MTDRYKETKLTKIYTSASANSGLSPPSHLTVTTRIRTAPIMGATAMLDAQTKKPVAKLLAF